MISNWPVIKRILMPDQLADLLTEMILSGELQPGARLLQDKLAAELGVSRTPLREALVRLQREGLVTLSGARGVEVTKFDAAELLELYDFRSGLDGLAAQLAARNLRPEDAAELKSSLDKMSELVDHPISPSWLSYNIEFHKSLIEASHNRYLQQLYPYIQRSSQLFHRMLIMTPEHMSTTHDQHSQIYEAIVAGDAEAAESLAKAHIASNSEMVRRYLTRGK